MSDQAILTPALLDQVRSAAGKGQIEKVRAFHPGGLTLGAALECACWWSQGATVPSSLAGWQDAWLQRYPVLATACDLLNGTQIATPVPGVRAAPRHELRRLASREDLLHDDWDLFLDRFRRSLVQSGGFGSRAAQAISFALSEMADNLIQHSGQDEASPAPGLSGYHVEPDQFSFVVADVGRGVLASLHENPEWAALPDATSALAAIVRERATRRTERQYGDGFKRLYEWLADLYGSLRFHSGGGLFSMDGLVDCRVGVSTFTDPLPGFQVNVTCGRGRSPEEIPL